MALLGWGGVGASGLGKAPPGQRPRPLGTFFGAVKTLAMAAPPVALAPRSCKGFGVPVQTQSGHFLSLFWLEGPRAQPRGWGMGPCPPTSCPHCYRAYHRLGLGLELGLVLRPHPGAQGCTDPHQFPL